MNRDVVVPEIVTFGLVLLLLLAAYWSMVIFPRQREFQKRQKLVRAMQVDDEVVTYGGIIGRVKSIDAETGVATVEIADGVVVRMLTAALVNVYDPAAIAEAVQRALPETRDSESASFTS